MTSTPAARSRFLPWFALLAAVVPAVAISAQSLWIDEAQTALKVIPPTIQGCWDALSFEHSSNLQLPLYILYAWTWARAFGVSEVALRAANIPFFFLGFYAIWHFLRARPALRNAVALLYFIHPFVWFYLGEARPYIMQLSGALLVGGAVFSATVGDEGRYSAKWWWLLAAGMAILMSAAMLGVPWGMAAAGALACKAECRKSIRRQGIVPLAVLAAWLTVLASYYAWTIKENASAAPISMTRYSVGAIFYELFGFMGLGPGRNTLRSSSIQAVRQYLAPLLLLAALMALGMVAAMRQRFWLTFSQLRALVLAPAAVILLLLVAGELHQNRLLGRHFTPFFPLVLLAQAVIVLVLWQSASRFNRMLAVLLVAMLLVSSIEVRFAARHEKDDYRDAVAAAKKELAQGQVVWWIAAVEGAWYYGLPVTWQTTEAGSAVWSLSLPTSPGAPPDDIFLSKVDLFDPKHDVVPYLRDHHYRQVAEWPAIIQWEKMKTPTATP